jgi:Tfp pilus assembly protein PilN
VRPVNLIPAEDRRGEQAPLRTGAVVYLVVGAFVAILVAVIALVLIGNRIDDSKAKITSLKREDAVVVARVRELSPYTQFKQLSEQRVATVTSLADSRFDWERVMRELALVLPRDVWLVGLTATVAPEISFGEGSGDAAGLRSSVDGPALELMGCAAGQTSVAGFVTALKDIDGVTRVGVESSELPDKEAAAGVSASGESAAPGNEDCRTRDFIAKFQLVVAFDAAPTPASASTEVVPAGEAATEETATSEETTESAE